MRGVHEADDAVVHVAGQVGGEEGGAVARAELRPAPERAARPAHAFAAARAGNEDPGVAVALFAGKGGGVDAGGVEVVAGR